MDVGEELSLESKCYLAAFSTFLTVFLAVLTAFFSALFNSLASLATRDLRREAVFFLSKPFLTALSYSLWIFFMFSAVGLALKFLRAALMAFLISWFLAVRLVVCLAAFLADLMIGI